MGSCLRRPLVATLFVCLLLVPLALPAAAAEGLRIEEVKASEAMKFPLPGEKVPEPRGLPEYAPEGMAFFLETEPNDTAATANALAGSGAVVYGTITAGDNDYFAFTANAGDRVSAAVMTQFSNVSGDSRLDIIGTDGTTSLEFDDDSGSFSGLSSAISGTLLPAAGTYYVRVYGYSATTVITPYHLHVKVASGSATAEVEPNNDLATATPLPASGWVSGTITATTDPDFFSFSLNAGDSVFLALDMDPDRAAANTNWNGRVGFGIFAGNQILVANDSSTTKPHAEAFFMTVRDAGTYYAYIDSTSATGLGANARYHLHVRVIPARVQTDCTLITSTNVPVAIGPGVGTVTSTISVPGTVTSSINDVKVRIDLQHALMADLDVALVAPSATSVPLFTDVGATTTGGQDLMDLVLDENAALPIGPYTVVRGMVNQPEQPGRLAAFNGQAAGGTWTLQLADDAANNAGTLNAWSLEICGTPPPAYAVTLTKTVGLVPGVCATTSSLLAPPGATVYYCYTVSNTGLNPLTSHDLVDSQLGTIFTGFAYTLNPGASIDTVALGLSIPAVVSGTVTNTATWTGHSGGNSASAQASATVTVPAFCGAGFREVALAYSDFSGSFPPAGWTVANTSSGCTAPGVPEWTNTNPGARANLTGGTGAFAIADSDRCGSGSTLDTTLTTPVLDLTAYTDPRVFFQADYDDIGTGGDRALLEVSTDGGATWAPDLTWDEDHRGPLTILEPIPGAGASGVQVRWHYENATYDWWWMVDNAMVLACRPVAADLAITKTDGVTTAVPGTNTTYTIVASNAGPDPVTGATVADTFPAACTGVAWTCVGAGGGTCTANGTGNLNDLVNLPAGGSVTYTAVCAISPAATGSLSNAATVTSALTDPVPGNNSATDTDTLTPQADLAITKTDGLTTAGLGQASTYTIGVANAGPSAAPASVVTDTFPAGFGGVTWTCAGAGGATCTPAGAGNIADTASLPVGGSVIYTASGTIGGSPGTLSNTATVAPAAGIVDPVPGNNAATDTTTVVAGAVVSGSKTVTGPFAVGDTITYTVLLTNSGQGGQNDNPGDEFTDPLPTGLTYVDATATSGTVAFAGGIVTWNGAIPAGGTVTITIQATIDAGTDGQTISNQGTISYDSDGDDTNDATASTDDPGAGGSSDPTSFLVGLAPSVLEIPTLSALGLAALALVLALFALALLRRRQAA